MWSKPFRFAVLLARIRSQLRQHEHSEDAVFRVGPYSFKPAQKLLLRDDDKKIRLTEKETAIIKFLYRVRRTERVARYAVGRCLGLQCRRFHAHA